MQIEICQSRPNVKRLLDLGRLRDQHSNSYLDRSDHGEEACLCIGDLEARKLLLRGRELVHKPALKFFPIPAGHSNGVVHTFPSTIATCSCGSALI
jgi:hypothetical protein